MKRVSIDLSVLNTRFPTGISRYTALVAQELLGLENKDIEWFSTGNIESPIGKNIGTNQHLPYEFPIHDLEETSRQLSSILEIAGVDAHFSPYYPLPALGNYSSFLTIFDLLPLKNPEWFSNQNVRNYFNGPLRKSAERASHIFAISESTRQDVHEVFGIPLDRITAIHLAATLSPSKTGAKTRLIEAPYLLCVGTLEPRKNLERTLLAYEQLIEQNPDLPHRLVLVGTYGWKSGDLMKRIERLGDRILFMGYLSDEDLATCYLHADGLIYASLAEGFGLPILEAFECGVPVVTSDSSSMPEVGGDLVFYCEPTSIESISTAINKLLNYGNNKPFQQKMKKWAEKFTWKKTAEKTLEIICAAWE